jgi:UDP:flavonoid glycosyltransferase YjiC (YdhE family)
VYVTFGTESSAMPFFADLVLASAGAAVGLGLEAIVAVGRGVDLEQFGPVPNGVEIVEWVDQAAVMAKARAVVCHAGAGTTLAALAAGVPIVAVPMFADQPPIAERVAATGCGTVVSPGPDLSRDVASALAGVVAEPPAGCATMKARLAELAPISVAVDLVEQSAGRPPEISSAG